MRTKALLFTLLFSLLAVSAHAQFKASLQGTVMDPNGAVVASAKVTITEQSTGLTRESVTSDQGFYRISELPPGRYTVTVEAAGFKQSISKDVDVKAEEPLGFDVTLQMGMVQEQIMVSASAPLSNTVCFRRSA